MADPRGAAGAAPPTRPNSFIFACFRQKAPASEVGAPFPPPQREILDPQLVTHLDGYSQGQHHVQVISSPVADPGFPVGGGAPTRWGGGGNLRHVHFWAKTKEIDPVGGGGGRRGAPPRWIRQCSPHLHVPLYTPKTMHREGHHVIIFYCE